MRTYLIKATYCVDVHAKVQANSKEEADEKAYEASLEIDNNWIEYNAVRDFQYTVEEKK